ncbi:saccharopine dehydrogenase family protein [Embleya sp. NPDC008237]|uniref:saccharopine dehydrogenase family protein n=1 Tax=Embleya sp. NPDC008237 TaxID=3363978 RepID=UPI0036EC23B0
MIDNSASNPLAAAETSPTSSARPVAVYGAYGHTARFVVAELHRRGRPVVLVGRDGGKLDAFGADYPDAPRWVAAADDPEALDRAFAGVAAVVNCAGPFLETTLPVADAAIRAGAHYLDVAAEQAATVALFDTRSEPAAEQGLVLAPSMAFYGGLGDLLATVAMGDWPNADEITLAFALDSWLPTAGTRLTGETNAGQHMVFTNGRLSPFSYSTEVSDWEFPAPFGKQQINEFSSADQVTIPRHLDTPEVRAVMNLAPLTDIRNPATPAPSAADEHGRSAQTYVVEAIVRRGDREQRAVVAGRDIYAVTAPIVVEAVERILAGAHTATGTVAAGQAFAAESFLRALTPEHLTRFEIFTELPTAASTR